MDLFSIPHLLILFGVIIVLFGAKRLPEIGSGLGQAISNFKKSYRDGMAIDVTPPKNEPDGAKPEDQKKS